MSGISIRRGLFACWSHRPHQPASSNRPRQHGHPPSQPFTRAQTVEASRVPRGSTAGKASSLFSPCGKLATPTVSALSRHKSGHWRLQQTFRRRDRPRAVDDGQTVRGGSREVSVTFLAAAHPSHGLPGVGTVLPRAPWPPGRLSRGHTVFYVGPHGSTPTMRTVTQITMPR